MKNFYDNGKGIRLFVSDDTFQRFIAPSEVCLEYKEEGMYESWTALETIFKGTERECQEYVRKYGLDEAKILKGRSREWTKKAA